MSQETIQWLNDNVLVGFVKDRENWIEQPYTWQREKDGPYLPWFADENYTNAYDEEVPMDALEKLFEWEALLRPSMTTMPCEVDDPEMTGIDNAGQAYRLISDPNRRQVVRSDNDFIMNVRKKDYEVHQYMEWLVNGVAAILDSDVQCGSAGLLRGGGAAWVSCELPETMTSGLAGYPVRSRILAFTSHDSLYTTNYLMSKLSPVCDNSLTGEIRRDDGTSHQRKWTQKHVAGQLQIANAREALQLLHKASEDDLAFFDELAKWEIEPGQFRATLNILQPMPEKKEKQLPSGKMTVTNQGAINAAADRRTTIATIYAKDPRAAQWKGTALGAYQAFNTFDQHHRNVTHEADRFGRNMHETLTGKGVDATVLNTLAEVCGKDKELIFS